MEDCIFCKIVSGKIPAAKIYEDIKVISFLDIMPANKGHCLVVPKKHSQNIMEMNDEDLASAVKTAKKIAKAMSLALGNSGFNLVVNNGKEAGQLVNHAHIHIIPRFPKDRLRLKWTHKVYEGNEMKEFAEKIGKFI